MGKTFDNINDLKIAPMSETIEENEQPEATPKGKTPKGSQMRPRQKKGNNSPEKKRPEQVISSKSPIVYLLQNEKVFLDKLKAFILLETGEKVNDHTLVIAALEEYAQKHYKGFSDKFKK